MHFIPIHLERSTLTLHILALIFYPCCCYLMHIPTAMQMLHPLHGWAGIYHPSRKTVSTTWVSKKWSKKINWFTSRFVWNRMRIWHGNYLAPTTRRVINWDRRLGNLTVCRLRVWDMSVILNLAFLLCTRITNTRTRKARGRNQCGFTTLSFYNSFTQSSLRLKPQNFFTTIISLLFISSPLMNSMNIQISLKHFPILISCGWGEMLVIKRGIDLIFVREFLSGCAG